MISAKEAADNSSKRRQELEEIARRNTDYFVNSNEFKVRVIDYINSKIKEAVDKGRFDVTISVSNIIIRGSVTCPYDYPKQALDFVTEDQQKDIVTRSLSSLGYRVMILPDDLGESSKLVIRWD